MKLKKLYEREMRLQEELAKIRVKDSRKPGDLRRTMQLEDEILELAHQIGMIKADEQRKANKQV